MAALKQFLFRSNNYLLSPKNQFFGYHQIKFFIIQYDLLWWKNQILAVIWLMASDVRLLYKICSQTTTFWIALPLLDFCSPYIRGYNKLQSAVVNAHL